MVMLGGAASSWSSPGTFPPHPLVSSCTHTSCTTTTEPPRSPSPPVRRRPLDDAPHAQRRRGSPLPTVLHRPPPRASRRPGAEPPRTTPLPLHHRRAVRRFPLPQPPRATTSPRPPGPLPASTRHATPLILSARLRNPSSSQCDARSATRRTYTIDAKLAGQGHLTRHHITRHGGHPPTSGG